MQKGRGNITASEIRGQTTGFLELLCMMSRIFFLLFFLGKVSGDACVWRWELGTRIETQQTWKRRNYRAPSVMKGEEGREGFRRGEGVGRRGGGIDGRELGGSEVMHPPLSFDAQGRKKVYHWKRKKVTNKETALKK